MKNKRYFVVFLTFCLLNYNSLFSTCDFNSQASQDEFVYTFLYEILSKQDSGYYLEIGAGHPVFTNNSCFFEKKLGWDGVSIDISSADQQAWNENRKNPLLIADAAQCDYHSVLKKAPDVIDYLSLDVDRDYDIILQQIPFDEHIFKVITIEHDAYQYGDVYKDRERTVLSSLGYYLLCSDVSLDWNHNNCVQQCAFEDWWIHPSFLSDSLFQRLKALDLKQKDHAYIVSILHGLKL